MVSQLVCGIRNFKLSYHVHGDIGFKGLRMSGDGWNKSYWSYGGWADGQKLSKVHGLECMVKAVRILVFLSCHSIFQRRRSKGVDFGLEFN